jgi:hypothetical protein
LSKIHVYLKAGLLKTQKFNSCFVSNFNVDYIYIEEEQKEIGLITLYGGVVSRIEQTEDMKGMIPS